MRFDVISSLDFFYRLVIFLRFGPTISIARSRSLSRFLFLSLSDLAPGQIIHTGVCDLALSFGEGSDSDKDKRMSRPFGVALLIAGYDELNGHQLFFSDPSGTFVRYRAKAIGAGSEGAQSSLSESYNEDMTLEEAEELALSTLKQVMEEKISTENVELARVTKDKGYHGATTEEVGAVLERL